MRWSVLALVALAALAQAGGRDRELEEALRQQYDAFPYPPPSSEADEVEGRVMDALKQALGSVAQPDALGAAALEKARASGDISSLLALELHPELRLSSPSHLAELAHFVFGGHVEWCARAAPFRVLVAGGGTGHKTFLLASQLADMGARFELVHLDLSSKAIESARSRLASRRALRNATVSFVQGSIFDLPSLNLGQFDYIDCAGVLHHVGDAVTALRQLGEALAPGGGIGVLVYGLEARRGVYQVREALQLLDAAFDGARSTLRDRIRRARALLASLPTGHVLRADAFQAQHLASYLEEAGDTGLVDLFLNAHDEAFTVDGVVALARDAGLALVEGSLLPPVDYEPARLVTNATEELTRRAGALGYAQRARLAELLAPKFHHTFYLVHRRAGACAEGGAECAVEAAAEGAVIRSDTAARLAPHSVPIPVHFNPARTARKLLAKRRVGEMRWTHNAASFTFRFSRDELALLAAVDGQRSVGAVCEAAGPKDSDAGRCVARFAPVFRAFHSIGWMFLSARPLSAASLSAATNFFDAAAGETTEEPLFHYATLSPCGGDAPSAAPTAPESG